MAHSPDRPTHDRPAPNASGRSSTGPAAWSGARSRTRTLLLVAAFATLGIQLYGLYNPAPDTSVLPTFFEGEDKVVHFLIFAAPVFLFCVSGTSPRLLAGLFTLHAVLSEIIQGVFIPTRDGSWGDALADILGVAAALLLAAALPSRHSSSQDFGSNGAPQDR